MCATIKSCIQYIFISLYEVVLDWQFYHHFIFLMAEHVVYLLNDLIFLKYQIIVTGHAVFIVNPLGEDLN